MYARGDGGGAERRAQQKEAAHCLDCGCVAVATRFSAEIKKIPIQFTFAA